MKDTKEWKYDPKNVSIDALTLRDWFAGLALNGILANPTWNAAGLAAAGVHDISPFLGAARLAYLYADAMLTKPEG